MLTSDVCDFSNAYILVKGTKTQAMITRNIRRMMNALLNVQNLQIRNYACKTSGESSA